MKQTWLLEYITHIVVLPIGQQQLELGKVLPLVYSTFFLSEIFLLLKNTHHTEKHSSSECVSVHGRISLVFWPCKHR